MVLQVHKLKNSQRMATKSLSALKSRKEEIIDHLEDLVGKEEAQVSSSFFFFGALIVVQLQ